MSINTDCLSTSSIKVLRNGYPETGSIEFAPSFESTSYKTTLMPQPSVGLIIETKSGGYNTTQNKCGLLLQSDSGHVVARNGNVPTSLQNTDVLFGLYKGAHDAQSSITKLDWMGGYKTSCNSVIIDGDTQFYNLRTTSGQYIVRNGVLQISGGGGLGAGNNVDAFTLRVQGGVIAIGPRNNIANHINIGECTTTYGTGIAIGSYTTATCGSIDIGYFNSADCNTIAIGQHMPNTGADKQTLFRPGESSFIIGFSHGNSPALVVYNGRVNDHDYSQLRYTISLDKLATLANGSASTGSSSSGSSSSSSVEGHLSIQPGSSLDLRDCGTVLIGQHLYGDGSDNVIIGACNSANQKSVVIGCYNTWGETANGIIIGSDNGAACDATFIGHGIVGSQNETLFRPSKTMSLSIGFSHNRSSPALIVKYDSCNSNVYSIPIIDLQRLVGKTDELLALLSK